MSPRTIVAAAAVMSTAVRLWFAHVYFGFQTGDDVEIAEEAFRVAIGLKHVPWNVRSLLIPDLIVAPWVWIANAMGINDPFALSLIARYPFILLAGVNVFLVYAVGRRWYGEVAGTVASVLYAVHWIPLVYGSSLYPRTIAVTCILSACLLTAPIAGGLAALATTARYSEAIYVVSLILLRTKKCAAIVLGFLVGTIVFVGLYDWLTWSRPFGSLIAFAELTFVQRDASSRVVSQPVWWYVANLAHWLPVTLLPFLATAGLRKLTAFTIVPLVTLSAIYHKEFRYLQVMIPFVLLIAANGFADWWNRLARRRSAVVLLILAVPLGLVRIGTVTRRSTNAVQAARWLSAQHLRGVALSQAWAYGGRLILGNDIAIEEIKNPPDPALLRDALSRVDCVSMYTSDVPPGMRFGHPTVFNQRGGRSVTVYCHGALVHSRP